MASDNRSTISISEDESAGIEEKRARRYERRERIECNQEIWNSGYDIGIGQGHKEAQHKDWAMRMKRALDMIDKHGQSNVIVRGHFVVVNTYITLFDTFFGWGVAKWNCEDKDRPGLEYDEEQGKSIASLRARIDLAKKLADYFAGDEVNRLT